MRRLVVGCLTFVLGAVVLTPPAISHHSFDAEFDRNKVVTLRGYVTKIDWANPHIWFYVNVKGEDGTVTNWGFEMGPPHLVQARGWTRNTMKIGDEVIVNGTLAKNGSKRVNARTVTMAATGQRLGAASSEGQTPTQQ